MCKQIDVANLTVNANRECYIIPRLMKTNEGYKAHKQLGIYYTDAREIWENFSGNYGLHSLRSEGAAKKIRTKDLLLSMVVGFRTGQEIAT